MQSNAGISSRLCDGMTGGFIPRSLLYENTFPHTAQVCVHLDGRPAGMVPPSECGVSSPTASPTCAAARWHTGSTSSSCPGPYPCGWW